MNSTTTRPRLTGLGVGVLLLALGLIACGGWIEDRIIILLGFFLTVLLFAGAFLAWANLRGLEMQATTPAWTFAHQDFTLGLTLTNTLRWLDSRAVELDHSLLPYSTRRIQAPWIRAGSSVEIESPTRLVRRGKANRSGCRATSSFPFGLFRCQRELEHPMDLTILPRAVLPRELEQQMEIEHLEGTDEGHYVPDWAGDFSGVRDYQAGDPVKSIHWAASARSRELKVRERDRPVPRKFFIVFHSFCPPNQPIQPESFDYSMDLLSGLLSYCQLRQIPLELVPSFNEWKPIVVDDPRDILEPLMLLATARHRPDRNLDEVIRALRGINPGDRVYVVSDTPVRLWWRRLPDLPCVVTAMDNTDLRVRQPRLSRFRRISDT